jgi:hypothetical protein
VEIVSVTVGVVSVVTVTLAVSMVTVAGFEWPGQTHGEIFSIRALKSKPGVPGTLQVS